jgi:hypothetical protein
VIPGISKSIDSALGGFRRLPQPHLTYVFVLLTLALGGYWLLRVAQIATDEMQSQRKDALSLIEKQQEMLRLQQQSGESLRRGLPQAGTAPRLTESPPSEAGRSTPAGDSTPTSEK